MATDSLLQLESLVIGKINTIELTNDSCELSRELIVDKINNLVLSILPGCWFEGEFIDKENSDYLIYDLHLSGVHADKSFSSIRLIDFGDKIQLKRF
jgi:hypothetical protein